MFEKKRGWWAALGLSALLAGGAAERISPSKKESDATKPTSAELGSRPTAPDRQALERALGAFEKLDEAKSQRPRRPESESAEAREQRLKEEEEKNKMQALLGEYFRERMPNFTLEPTPDGKFSVSTLIESSKPGTTIDKEHLVDLEFQRTAEGTLELVVPTVDPNSPDESVKVMPSEDDEVLVDENGDSLDDILERKRKCRFWHQSHAEGALDDDAYREMLAAAGYNSKILDKFFGAKVADDKNN